MTAPYRELFLDTAPLNTASGHCPWCRADVRFIAGDPLAVCEACDATFATSIARVTEGRASMATGASSSAELRPPIEGVIAGRLKLLLLLAFELGLIAIFLFAIGRS